MALANKDIAFAACNLAARSDGLRRRAALCIAVAAGTTGSLAAARRALDSVDQADIRTAAVALLDQLAAETVTGARQ